MFKNEIGQTSADYKPEEVHYKDINHNESSTLVNAFIENNDNNAPVKEKEEKISNNTPIVEEAVEENIQTESEELSSSSKGNIVFILNVISFIVMFTSMFLIFLGINIEENPFVIIASVSLLINFVLSIASIIVSKSWLLKLISIIFIVFDIIVGCILAFVVVIAYSCVATCNIIQIPYG